MQPLNDSLIEQRNDRSCISSRRLLQDYHVVFEGGDCPSGRRLSHLLPVLSIANKLGKHGLLEDMERLLLHQLRREQISKLAREGESQEDRDRHIGHLRDWKE